MNSDKYQIRIGYACINTELRDYDVFTSRSLILKTATSKGIDYVKQLALENIDDLFKILIFNEAHGIRFYRISSNMLPHLSNPKFEFGNYDLDFIKNKLKIIGSYAKNHSHRLTAHPSQYVQLGSPNENVYKQSIVDLENHVKLFKAMNLNPTDGSVLIIHGGGTFGNKQAALERWEQNYLKLPTDIQEYIVLENDENNYNPTDLLPICEKLNIPFCLDIFHNRVSKDRIPITKNLIKRIFATWLKRGLIPKIHVSEQQVGLRRGAHSKTLNRLPLYLLRLSTMFKTPLDIMLEVKDKEVSVFKIYHKYFDIKTDHTGRVDYVLKKTML
jgi:UV DNA damage endonuclease